MATTRIATFFASTPDARHKSHEALEKALLKSPHAECRIEDLPNAKGKMEHAFTVWDGPHDVVPMQEVKPLPAQAISSDKVNIVITPEDMEKLADLVAQKLFKMKG